MSSIFNDPNANGNTVASLNGALGSDAASQVYDFEEGIRKHTQTIYGPVLGILFNQAQQTQDLLESLERGDKGAGVDRYFEDYKKEHQQKMSTWKMQSVQSRLRGGGVNHAIGGVGAPQIPGVGGGMMLGGGGMHMPQMSRHFSIQMQQQ
jgi:hypothetical protein